MGVWVELIEKSEFIFVKAPIDMDEKSAKILSDEARSLLTELIPGFGIFHRGVEGRLRHPQALGGNTDAPAVESAHGNFEAEARLAQHILLRDAAVLENEFCGHRGPDAHRPGQED